MLGAGEFKRYNNLPLHPWSPALRRCGLGCCCFWLAWEFEVILIPLCSRWCAEIGKREEELCSERSHKTAAVRESIMFLFVLYSERTLLKASVRCSLTGNAFMETFIRQVYINLAYFLKIAGRTRGDFKTGFISRSLCSPPPRFLHANVDYAILLITFQHCC